MTLDDIRDLLQTHPAYGWGNPERWREDEWGIWRRCWSCKQWWPYTKGYFVSRATNLTGLGNQCRLCDNLGAMKGMRKAKGKA